MRNIRVGRGETSKNKPGIQTVEKNSKNREARPGPLRPKEISLGPRSSAIKKTKPRQALNDKARKAVVTRNKEGLIEVNVEYSHLSALGAGCGLPIEAVARALDDDNEQRNSDQTPHSDETVDLEMDLGMDADNLEGPDISFDPDSGVDLDSEEEAGM